jgi:hypothetical protein
MSCYYLNVAGFFNLTWTAGGREACLCYFESQSFGGTETGFVKFNALLV